MAEPAFRLFRNPGFDSARTYGAEHERVIDTAERATARATVTSWPGYAPTPLVALPGLAGRLGVERVWLKNEGARFGLKSFKALGGAYAVMRVLAERMGSGARLEELAAGALVDRAGEHTVCCATDGNHGRAVAWGAQTAGARCVIFLHEHVSAGREQAIAAYGAEIARVPGTYDDSVRACAERAAENGWSVVSDTSYAGYMSIPRWVMAGYTIMVDEMLEQLGAERPTHVFVQGGVGGLAAAVIGALWQDLGGARPRPIVVEPHAADCLYQSARAGGPRAGAGDLDTVMACLAAAEVSPLAWPVIADGAFAFVTLADARAIDAMRHAAAGADGDPPVVLGESGVAALAGLMTVAEDRSAWEALELSGGARVLLIGSEGATDPEIYREIVGRTPEAVATAN